MFHYRDFNKVCGFYDHFFLNNPNPISEAKEKWFKVTNDKQNKEEYNTLTRKLGSKIIFNSQYDKNNSMDFVNHCITAVVYINVNNFK